MVKEIDYQITSLVDIDSYGGVHFLNLLTKDFLALGYEVTDIVEVSFLDHVLRMPIVKDFNYIDMGCDGLTLSNLDANYIKLITFGDLFAQKYGLVEVDEIGPHPWKLKSGVSFPINFHIRLVEKGGYKNDYEIFCLDRTNEESDYKGFTRLQFANFREVKARELKPHILYRSSSPIDPQLKRHSIVDEEMRRVGVKTIINVANKEDRAKLLPGYKGSYYSEQNVLFAPAPIFFFGDKFNAVVRDTVRYMLSHEGPYLIHCWEGKDRTGYIVAIFLSLIGAARMEIVSDYMESYVNFFKIERGSETYMRIALRIYHLLKRGFNIGEVYGVDLAKEAYDYLLRVGLTEPEINRLIKLLKK